MSVDSEEEVFFDSEEENDSYNCSDDEAMVETAEAAEEDCRHHTKKHYTVLTEETIKKLQENDIAEVSNVLSIPKSVACTLLLHKNWNVSSIFEEWFADEERLRNAIGLSRKEISPKPNNSNNKNKYFCKICMENVDIETMLSAACGHLFCSDCWNAHVAISINDGPGCLMLRCPEPSCKAFADLEIVDAVAAAEHKQIYYKYLYRSYVELSKNRKWCPAPDCGAAVEFDVGGSDGYDVSCICSHKFCWNCAEEAHRPVTCSTVAKWGEMNTSEANNTTWIAAFTKPCPSCKRKIEKNHGCNHMTCSKPCRHEFCWLCLETWVSYEHRCNTYRFDDAEQEASRAELNRYKHYFHRWSSNHRSRGIAARDLARARDAHVPLLAGRLPGLDLRCVVEAWEQIVECRRVLKWSYAYGFYIGAGEAEKKTFFECLQGSAEAALERLHYCAEKEMRRYVEADEGGLYGFGEFCEKLKSLTSVTRKFFEGLVGAFENDLCEVEI